MRFVEMPGGRSVPTYRIRAQGRSPPVRPSAACWQCIVSVPGTVASSAAVAGCMPSPCCARPAARP